MSEQPVMPVPAPQPAQSLLRRHRVPVLIALVPLVAGAAAAAFFLVSAAMSHSAPGGGRSTTSTERQLNGIVTPPAGYAYLSCGKGRDTLVESIAGAADSGAYASSSPEVTVLSPGSRLLFADGTFLGTSAPGAHLPEGPGIKTVSLAGVCPASAQGEVFEIVTGASSSYGSGGATGSTSGTGWTPTPIVVAPHPIEPIVVDR